MANQENTALQEALSVLLGAESESKRMIQEAQTEAESILHAAQDKFSIEREHSVTAARDQAKSILETALMAAQAEANQILSLAQTEREKMQQRFEENADAVVSAVLAETVDYFMAGGE